MPEVRLESQWYTGDAHADRPPPPALDTLPAGVWELPATPDALKEEIFRLQNSVAHLERSNAELAGEDPEDPDFKEAVEENEVVLVAQRYKIEQCELRLQQLGGGSPLVLSAGQEARIAGTVADEGSGGRGGGDGFVQLSLPDGVGDDGMAPPAASMAASLDLSDLQLRPAPLMTGAGDGAALDLSAIITAASTPGVAGAAPPVVVGTPREPEPEPAPEDEGLYL